VFWSGYRRYVREAGRYWKIFVPRWRELPWVGLSHALLPAFTLAWRLDAAETIGAVVGRWRPAGVRGPPGGGAGGGAVYDRPSAYPDRYRPNLVRSLRVLANALDSQGRTAKAEAVRHEADLGQ